MREQMIHFEGLLKAKTERAVLLVIDDEEYWVPRSALGGLTDREIDLIHTGTEIAGTMAEWLALAKGII